MNVVPPGVAAWRCKEIMESEPIVWISDDCLDDYLDSNQLPSEKLSIRDVFTGIGWISIISIVCYLIHIMIKNMG